MPTASLPSDKKAPNLVDPFNQVILSHWAPQHQQTYIMHLRTVLVQE